jgi:hypothetical protein
MAITQDGRATKAARASGDMIGRRAYLCQSLGHGETKTARRTGTSATWQLRSKYPGMRTP